MYIIERFFRLMKKNEEMQYINIKREGNISTAQIFILNSFL